MLRSISLRNKLLLAVGLPMIILIAGAGYALQASQKTVQSAATQSNAVSADLDLIALAQAIRTEQTAGLVGQGAQFAEVRAVTDQRFAAAIASTTNNEFRLTQMEEDLDTRIRPELGDDAVVIWRRTLRQRSAAEGQDTETVDLQDELGELAESAVNLVEVSGNRYQSGKTATQVASLINLATWHDTVSAEQAAIQLLLTGGAPTLERQINLLETSAAAEQSGAIAQADQLIDFGIDDAINDPSTQALFSLRERVRSSDIEGLRTLTLEAARGSERLTDGIQNQQDTIGEQIRSDIEQERSEAIENQRNILLGTLLIIAGTAIVLFFLYRAITQPITQLSTRGSAVAEDELPTMVTKIRAGEATAGSQRVVPLKSDTDDEIGELVGVFNNLHITAVNLAAEQAQSRKTASEMFVNLGHRNQRILDTVLGDLDELERDEQDPTRLAQLYDIDQKVTRMRRNAESLLVLAGTQTPRQWAEPAALADVVRAAMSEVENFTRVESNVERDVAIPGRAVADVTHLLAELIENSLRFSPPEEVVYITSSSENGRTVLTIADSGFGMSGEKLQDANNQIEQAAFNDETPSKHLGHYVVGRLSSRHGVSVRLEENHLGRGLEARVDLGDLTSNPEKELPSEDKWESPTLDTNSTTHSVTSPRTFAPNDAPLMTHSSAPDHMPTIDPAVPVSDEVASHTMDNDSKLVQHDAPPTAKERPSAPDLNKMAEPRRPRRRVPGAALGDQPTKTATSHQPTNSPSTPEAVREAFSAFQSSSPSAPAAEPFSGPPPHPGIERRNPPDFSEMTTPRVAKRRVPGASLPASRKTSTNPRTVEPATPEEVRDAFAGFQKSAKQPAANKPMKGDNS